MRHRKRLSRLLILLFSLYACSAFAQSANRLDVAVDNEYIQTYRGRLGQWLIPGGTSFSALAARFGTEVEDIQLINDGQLDRSRMTFVPMSLDYYNRMVAAGHGRRVFTVDERAFVWPIEQPSYTSRFGTRAGAMHTGLDLACPSNTVVVAADDGVVIRTGWMGALGQAVAVEHASGIVTWYGHNSVLFLKEGEQVRRGQIIAFSGSTGRSTGPHVHFEVRFMNVFLNPEDFLQQGLAHPSLVIREESPLELPEESALLGQRTGTATP
ncbi:MAG: M23 family metallopeptidase [Spirochaetales bacterium]|nr:M23 family metallopeptidase [Leptospiraceae bacterium]MCP5483178.1 M23 family metallopeptidase [Spirochaetales bacterium]MCP5486682.1 M23 family metallopeptidase [Spirochaetales bacterium]